eukprot:4470194-Pyramimonas_sp.AAC.1
MLRGAAAAHRFQRRRSFPSAPLVRRATQRRPWESRVPRVLPPSGNPCSWANDSLSGAVG